jgi:sugar phosphate isomerase/epimerase
MKTIKGPGIALAQFVTDKPPFNSLRTIAKWAAEHGYIGIQIPSFDGRLFDLAKAAESQTYCDEVNGICRQAGVEITELAATRQSRLVAVHPTYNASFDVFAPPQVHGNPRARQAWAVDQVKMVARASRNLGLRSAIGFTGALMWPFLYPVPQRPPGLIEFGFAELARRWRPILDVFEEMGVNFCFELHPGEDVFDGVTFDMFLEALDNHPRCCINYDPSHFLLQRLDYVAMIDIYHERIKGFHVKDAEFNPSGRQGVYSGYQPWVKRAARFRSPGDGQIDFTRIFSKLTEFGYDSWAVLEWECPLKSSEQGASEGAPFIRKQLIEATDRAFDDFGARPADDAFNRRLLGIA